MTAHTDDSNNRRIIVIDDNESIHEDFRKILMNNGTSSELDSLQEAIFGEQNAASRSMPQYEVDSALQGQEGFEKVKSALAEGRPYTLAFVDMRMPPGWDGLETTAQLLLADKDLQIVLCTAYSDYSWRDIYERFGHVDGLLLLKKPFDPAEVLQLACALTAKWRLGCQVRSKLNELEDIVHDRTRALADKNEHLEAQISQRLAAEAQLRHDADHDLLTNLPNRALLQRRLEIAVRRAESVPAPGFAVLFLDLDNFKLINDSLGHTAGDELLVETARRLSKALASEGSAEGKVGDTLVTRLGGDEFVILLDPVKDAREPYVVAEQIQACLAEPFQIADHEVTITASIGIALDNSESKSAEVILRDADTAMYRAKLGGKAQYSVFDEVMHTDVMNHLRLENELRWSLEKDQFELYYQPIVHLATGRIQAFEALLRWHHPERGLVPPIQFIPVLEGNGQIVSVGRWVLEEASRQLKCWDEQFPDAQTLSMCVNLSRLQIIEPGFVEEVREVLEAAAIEPSRIKLEITESVIMSSPTKISTVLHQLHDMGLELYMDDFGTGHSSLSCLHQFPFDVLKIDRAFVQTMGHRREYAAVVHAIVTLAHNLDMGVTAEGIEEADQIAQMIALECDHGQGYVFSRPVPAHDAATLIRGSRSFTLPDVGFPPETPRTEAA